MRKFWHVCGLGNLGGPEALLFYLWGTLTSREQDIDNTVKIFDVCELNEVQ